MMPHRAPALAVWLAALFVAVLGLLAPAPAAAHAGHAHHHAQAAPQAAPVAAPVAAGPVLAAPEAEAGLDTAGTQAPCGGAACCTAGHGCCAALAGSAPAGIARPRTPPPAPVLAGLPAGLGAATLPEPPRPFR